MKKIIVVLLSAGLLFSLLSVPVLAEEENGSSAQELIEILRGQIEQLKAQIESVRAQIETLRHARTEIKETQQEIKATLKLIRQLREGMSGEDVELLQEVLATDMDVYPEGLVTGYFGALTKNAVKRFQKIAGLEEVGCVGPKTMARINQLLEEGAGNSGQVPPGLLIAPGLRKKFSLQLRPLPGQELPPGIAKRWNQQGSPVEDDTPPVISDIAVVDITATSAKVTWLTDEEADGRVWYDTVTPLVVDDDTLVVSSADFVLSHEIVLPDLTADTVYYYLVNSVDEEDNSEISLEGTFTTLSEIEQACIDSGGEVSTSSCCESTSDFPDLCVVGACGCAPENSHDVQICDCGEGKCFDGTECVDVE